MSENELRWTDVYEIGFRLVEAHPDVDPLSVRFTDLHAWVCALEGFVDALDKLRGGFDGGHGSSGLRLGRLRSAWAPGRGRPVSIGFASAAVRVATGMGSGREISATAREI